MQHFRVYVKSKSVSDRGTRVHRPFILEKHQTLSAIVFNKKQNLSVISTSCQVQAFQEYKRVG